MNQDTKKREKKKSTEDLQDQRVCGFYKNVAWWGQIIGVWAEYFFLYLFSLLHAKLLLYTLPHVSFVYSD